MNVVKMINPVKILKSQFATSRLAERVFSKLVTICDQFNMLKCSRSQNATLKVGDKLSHPFRENKTKFLSPTIRNFQIVRKWFEMATIKKYLIVQNV